MVFDSKKSILCIFLKGKVIMKKINLSKALKGKGTYIAIAGCAVIAGGAGIFAYNKAIKELNTELTYIPPSSNNTASSETPSEQSDVGISISLSDELAALTEAQPKFMPVPGEVVLNPFSNGELVKSETLGIWKTHDGVDLQADVGTSVKAMTGGTVTEVKNDAMWGNCITIDHGEGVVGYYCNLSSAVNVKEGDIVDAGEAIGVVGNTAEAEISMQPHLHFALKQNGKWIDPMVYINPTDK